MDNRFLELVRNNDGFEVCLGFYGDLDHYLGGTGDTVWYCVQKGKNVDCFIGKLENGEWTDTHIVKKRTLKTESAESGKTISMITEKLFLGQDRIAADGRRPVQTELSGHSVSHYAFDFGETAYEISDEYGVTVSYSYVNDVNAGFRMRNLYTGENVKVPEIG